MFLILLVDVGYTLFFLYTNTAPLYPILAGLTTPFLLAKASMFSSSEGVKFIAPGIEVDDAVITRILVSDARVDHESARR